MPIIGAIGQEAVDVTATAGGLTATTAHGIPPAAAECVVSEGSLRYCVDGTTATEDVGLLKQPGDTFYLKNRGEVTLFSAIRIGDDNARVDATLAVDYKP